MQISLKKVRSASMNHPGMVSDFLRLGSVIDGSRLDISRADFDAIMAKHCPGGLGNVIHEVLKPAVVVVDRVAGTDMANCGGCAERQLRMNAIRAVVHN